MAAASLGDLGRLLQIKGDERSAQSVRDPKSAASYLRLAETEFEGEPASCPHAHVLKDKVGTRVTLEVGHSMSVSDEIADEGAELLLLASFGTRFGGRLG